MTGTLTYLRCFWRDEVGTVLVELAVVLGIFVLMIFGLIDFGRLGFSYVLSEKATETAVRMAVVRPAICPNVPQVVRRTLLGTLNLGVRNGTRCSDAGGVCRAPAPVSCDGSAGQPDVAAIWAQIAPLLPVNAGPENLRFTYSYDAALNRVGAAYAPVVTVEIVDLTYQFISPLGAFVALAGGTADESLAADFTFSSMSASLPSEDLR
ncbi:TadE/TadG family type IV pilus assembly protein [Thalassococcus sp. BH17M4-6]|uniref:TadE/TadG family type IV pilus assembly protein n=1 Tax=Thalassococcus sp. BH17M4-6 TaxID=3413148 RepID=UPI003BBD5DC8